MIFNSLRKLLVFFVHTYFKYNGKASIVVHLSFVTIILLNLFSLHGI